MSVFFETLSGIVVGSIVVTLLFPILLYCGQQLLKQYLKYEFDLKLEDYKAEELRRQKAALIANLISEWLENDPENLKELGRLTFEAYLWLPKEIMESLAKTLTKAHDAPNYTEILSLVKKLQLKKVQVVHNNLLLIGLGERSGSNQRINIQP